jgi:hypothetical protein
MGELVPGCTVEYCVDDTLRLHFGPEVDCLKVTVPVKERYRAHFYHAFRVYFSRFPPPYYNRDNWEHLCYYLRDTCSVFVIRCSNFSYAASGGLVRTQKTTKTCQRVLGSSLTPRIDSLPCHVSVSHN